MVRQTVSDARSKRKRRRIAAESEPADDGLSLVDRAYEAIKRKILALEYRPGQWLNESRICDEFGFGRTPVHHAVHRLSRDGLLEIIPRKGLMIRPDSMNEVLDLMEARSSVEPNVAALAAERASPEQVKAMRTMLAQSAKITDKRYRRPFMEIDRAFHATIAEAAGNPILADVIRPLHERSGRLWFLRLHYSDDLATTQVEHEAILAAIEQGDRDAAARAMQRHITSLRRRRITDKE